MKTIRAAIILILLFASVAALADSYQIRVTWPVRLRASFSMDSPVVGKALAGDVLQVVGRFNRWLKIDRNGEIAWLADWVDYSRLDQEQTAAEATNNQQQPSGIDNCCFIDRQCQSQREWVDGYWAYQRDECPALPPQPSQSSPQIAGHPTIIEGSFPFISFLTEALDLMRTRSLYWYDYVVGKSPSITENKDLFTARVFLDSRRIEIAPYGRLITSFDHEKNLARTVSLLVHEASHIHRYDAGYIANTWDEGIVEESACIEQERAALRDMFPPRLHNEHSRLGILFCNFTPDDHPLCAEYG